MTNEEKLEILRKAQERLYREIDNTRGADMALDSFARLMDTAHKMYYHEEALLQKGEAVTLPATAVIRRTRVADLAEVESCPENPEPDNVAESDDADATPSEDPYDIPDDPKPVEEPKEEPAPEAPVEKLPTKEEVRCVLSPLSAAGMSAQIAGIFKQMGYNRLSEIPQERYPELLKLVEEAKANADAS